MLLVEKQDAGCSGSDIEPGRARSSLGRAREKGRKIKHQPILPVERGGGASRD